MRMARSHRLPAICTVVTPALGLLLWHGGFEATAQVALALVAAAGLVAYRPAPRLLRAPVLLGLAAVAAANLASLAAHPHRSSVAPALAANGIAAVAWVGVDTLGAVRARLPQITLVLALTSGTAGLAGLALHSSPLAERIARLWRAQGTFEYAPALGLVCVCALACVLALCAEGRLDRSSAVIAAAVLALAIAATFDRASWIEGVAVIAWFAVRLPALRPVAWVLAAVAVGCAVLALAISHPSRSALESHLRHGTYSTRDDAWRHAWDAARDQPLLGYGPGRYPVPPPAPGSGFLALAPPPAATQAHNAVLQQGVEAGLIAAAGTALALVAMLLAGARALASSSPRRLALGSAAAAIAVSGLYDFTWSFPPIVILGSLAALAAGEHR